MVVSRDEFEEVKQLLATAARVSERNTRAIDQLTANQQMIQQDIQLIFQRMENTQARMENMQSDIRGMQTENRRILERLERHMSDGHGG